MRKGSESEAAMYLHVNIGRVCPYHLYHRLSPPSRPKGVHVVVVAFVIALPAHRSYPLQCLRRLHCVFHPVRSHGVLHHLGRLPVAARRWHRCDEDPVLRCRDGDGRLKGGSRGRCEAETHAGRAAVAKEVPTRERTRFIRRDQAYRALARRPKEPGERCWWVLGATGGAGRHSIRASSVWRHKLAGGCVQRRAVLHE